MKKLRYFILCFILLFAFAGCTSGNAIPLRDDESDSIAQYCAYLIMKYDKNKLVNEKLLDTKDLEKKQEELLEAEAKAAEKAAKDSKKQSESKQSDEEASKTGKEDSDDKEKGSSKDEPKTDDDSSHSGKESKDKDSSKNYNTEYYKSAGKLTECYYKSKLGISVKKVDICDVYTGAYESFAITAPAGKKIWAVSIDIKNSKDSSHEFNYENYQIQYRLMINKNFAIVPEISLLTNDIQFLKTSIEPGNSYEAVLLFFVDEGIEEGTLLFLGENSDKSAGKAYEINIQTTEVANGN